MASCPFSCSLSSLTKKYLMAVTGFIMAGFVFLHMIGNLQMFLGPDAINTYAHFLKTLPLWVMWGGRLFLIAAGLIHVWMAIVLTKENNKAHNVHYQVTDRVEATLSSRTMGITGSVLFFFIVFHLLHFTVHLIHPEYDTSAYVTTLATGERVFDVYHMVINGFSYTWVSLFYIVAMALLCMHLSHGVSSMFQSLGFRNRAWKLRLDRFAKVYGWVIFFGFITNPAAVLIAKYTDYEVLPLKHYMQAVAPVDNTFLDKQS